MIHKTKSGQEIYLDGYLKSALDSMVFNVQEDWDFLIIITGDRMVRTGKTVLAMNIGCYLADRLGTEWNLDHIFFDSESMIQSAQKFPKNSVLQYDEARESLASVKYTQKIQQDLMDYFNECGQLNHIFILVLPDFFSLKEEIAVGRSECLINVYRKGQEQMLDIYKDGVKIPVTKFQRGFFEFYNRQKKQYLFDGARSSRKKNYHIVKANFVGRFTNNYTVDEQAYRKKKAEALARFSDKKKQEQEARPQRSDVIRDTLILGWLDEGLTQKEIAHKLNEGYGYNIQPRTVSDIVKRIKKSEIGNAGGE